MSNKNSMGFAVILSLDIRDYSEVQHMFRRYPRAIFGLAMPYTPESDFADILAQGEDLFISAHGSPSTIGHPTSGVRFSAAELAKWLTERVVPCNFFGNIYIAAPGANQHYINELLDALGSEFESRVHGLFDVAYSQIVPPGRNNWVRAA
ncbi:hypothetical protein BST95_12490 [Halioglobus japonicus]|uniref:Uncharacterized protein n=1 Tax=Halioglobus japonicus TaxID=930805 RepID=A0AAP8SPU6_9GAMM|nr:hypothetical protein [Halioglobus japonicus]AQA18935.1 hypothetical protein BST95_12490 [Halioglobus japonicus]PLW88050.1 hypothetical protein C0029_05680 [Halioglobus japonicus]GHD20591.1 hypothetical protein GCM10007052_30460 [Halioglobus japonicus]